MMFSFTALLCPLLFLAFLITIIVLIVRSVGRRIPPVESSASIPPRFNPAAQLAADGFWLSAFEPASIVYYYYWVGETRHAGQIAFQPGPDGRQFVYTGSRPDRVEIARTVGPSGDYTSATPTYIDDDTTPTILGAAAAAAAWEAASIPAPEPPPPPPPQFPSAY